MVRESFPDLMEVYNVCYAGVAGDKYAARSPPPELLLFVRAFLTELGKHSTLKNGDFFTQTASFVDRTTCMDCARVCMGAMSARNRIQVELQDEVHPDDSVSHVGSYAPSRSGQMPRSAPMLESARDGARV